MYFLVALLTFSVLGIIALGLYLELTAHRRPRPDPGRAMAWFKGSLAVQIALFVVGEMGLLALGYNEAFAGTEVTDQVARGEISVGMGLAIIGAGLPTALATVGAALAVGPVGSAALAVIAERPETFGRSLVYLGLAEGIAIYGLVMSILLLGKIS